MPVGTAKYFFDSKICRIAPVLCHGPSNNEVGGVGNLGKAALPETGTGVDRIVFSGCVG